MDDLFKGVNGMRKDLQEILKEYQQLNKVGLEKWLEDIPEETDWMATSGFHCAIGKDLYEDFEREAAITIGDNLVKVKKAMAMLKLALYHNKRLYESYSHLKYDPKANPDIVTWVKDYEAAHPEVLDKTVSQLRKICPVCGKEFTAKAALKVYCSENCFKKKQYAKRKQEGKYLPE